MGYFKHNSLLCIVNSYELLDVDTSKVPDRDVESNSFDFTDLNNFIAPPSKDVVKLQGDSVKLNKKNQDMIDMNLGDIIVSRKYIKATTISGHFAIQPLEVTVKKTYNEAPKFVGTSIEDLRVLDVTVSQKEILEGNSDPLIFMLPEAKDFEEDEISIEVQAMEGQTWVSVVETEFG